MLLEIFKIGQHTSSNGITKSFTENDLDSIAQSYNPSEHEAPVCIGHPKDNSPAHGWVKKLIRKGESLFAEIDDLSQGLKDALKNKLFKKRSVALYPDSKLRHLAFVPVPAVKGLNDIPDSDLISLNEENQELLYFEDKIPYKAESDLSDSDVKASQSNDSFSSNIDSLHKSFLTLHSQIKELHNLVTEQKNKPGAEANEKPELKTPSLNLDLEHFEKNLNEKVTSGTISPAVKSKLFDILEFISSYDFGEVNNGFPAGLNSKFDELINTLPPLSIFSEVAEKPSSSDAISELYAFAEVDKDSSDTHVKALSLMKSENISYLAAVTKLLNKN